MAKRTTEKVIIPVDLQENMATVLAENLNKKFKTSSEKVAYFLEGTDDSPSEVTDWISTGNDIIDLAISNRPNGGFPVGRITELGGLEGVGKSLIAAHALVSTQKKGGLAVYIDTENAVSKEFLEAIGVNLAKMLYVPLETVEDIFEAVESIIEGARKSSKDKVVTIVIDSLAGATTKVEQAGDFDKTGWNTSKAIILSQAMRKITNLLGRSKVCMIICNQLRVKLGMGFGDQFVSSGGKAIGYHSSVRIRLKAIGKIKLTAGEKDVVGVKTEAHIFKNRMGPPERRVEFEIYYDSGIDNYTSWITTMLHYGLLEKVGFSVTYNRKDTGETIKFRAKNLRTMLEEDPVLKKLMYDDICDVYILKYKLGDSFSQEDVEVDSKQEEPDEN